MKSHLFIKILFSFIIIIFCFYLYGHYVEPTILTTKEIGITSNTLNSDYNGLKIAQFSDIHYGKTTEELLRKTIKELNKLNADIIVFTGDLFDNKNISSKEKELMINYLSKIKYKLFKFAVIGDYDQDYLETYQEILAASNFILLDNSSKLIYYKSPTPINIIGLSNTNDIASLYDNDYFNITITHKPDNIKNLNNTPIVLAGHSLGGQIKIPFMGGIRKIDGAQTYIDNYYEINNSKLYISNGIGTQDYNFRLFNPPSITLYRLYNY